MCTWINHCVCRIYCALQVSCLGRVREWNLFLSTEILCITELSIHLRATAYISTLSTDLKSIVLCVHVLCTLIQPHFNHEWRVSELIVGSQRYYYTHNTWGATCTTIAVASKSTHKQAPWHCISDLGCV